MTNIRWAERPPSDADLPGMDLRRCPANGTLTAIITSTWPTTVPTHFYGGQTVPCVTEGCAACREKRGKTWHVYISVLSPTPSTHYILELTDKGAQPIFDTLDMGRPIRGVKITANRKTTRKNGKVIIQLNAASIGTYQLPPAADLRAQLTRIWRMDETKIAEQTTNYANQVANQLETQERSFLPTQHGDPKGTLDPRPTSEDKTTFPTGD